MGPNGVVVVLDDEEASIREAVEQVLDALDDRIELGRLELPERSSRIGGSLAFLGVALFFAACAWVALLVAAARRLDQLLPPVSRRWAPRTSRSSRGWPGRAGADSPASVRERIDPGAIVARHPYAGIRADTRP